MPVWNELGVVVISFYVTGSLMALVFLLWDIRYELRQLRRGH